MFTLSSLIGLLIERASAAEAVWEIYCSPFGACGDGRGFLIDLAGRTAMVIFSIVGGGAVLAVLWATNVLVFSGGDDSKREEAKKIITAALFGLMFAIMGSALVVFVSNFVKGFAG
jgi:hypothetical protein